jgi:putative membrane protein
MLTMAQAAVPSWHPHWDVWALLFVLGFGYAYAVRRIGPHMNLTGPVVTRRQVAAYSTGLLLMWIVSDWPIHDIAEQHLFMFHMIEHITLGLVVPPLLIVGTPVWMLRAVLANRFVLPIIRPLVVPVVAFFVFDLTLIGIHWPDAVNLMVRSPLAHFLIHSLLFAVSIVMWIPVLSRVPELPRLSPPAGMLYLFVHSLLPTIPASFLTFGTEPLYSAYAEAPRLWGIDTITDQTVAGLIMKLGGGAIIWGVIVVMWFRWYANEQRWEAIERQLRESA